MTVDRMRCRSVYSLVRTLALALAVSAAAACGGGSSSKKTTTPGGGGASAGEPEKSDTPEPTAYEETAGGFDAPEQPAGPAPQDVEPVMPEPPKPTTPTPEAPKAEPVKPPGNDLSPERKRQLVAEHLRLAGGAIRSRDADKAINEAKKALNVDETNVEAMIVLAHAYYLKEYDDKALAILKIAQGFPEGKRHAVGWMIAGLLHDRAGKESDALNAYEQATAIKPDYLNALNNQGVIYLKRKRYADAASVFEKVVQVQSNNPRGHTHLGASYRGHAADNVDGSTREQLLRRAEQELKLAMSQDPTYAPAYFNLGLLYLDADPFPGLETLLRFQNAQRYLNEYKRLAGPKAGTQVDDFIAAAQKGYDREKRAIEKKKKAEEKKRKEGAEQPKPAEPAPDQPKDGLE